MTLTNDTRCDAEETQENGNDGFHKDSPGREEYNHQKNIIGTFIGLPTIELPKMKWGWSRNQPHYSMMQSF